MKNPCEKCLLQMICIEACNPFIKYAKISSDLIDSLKGDRDIVLKRAVSVISKVVLRKL